MTAKTILVVEDNELNLKLVKGLLTIGKYNTLTALDAETGLDLARRHRPDLILMDIQLPGIDGLSATKQLKSDVDLKHIPVIALTSYAMQGDDQTAKAAGCNGYMTKPIDTRNFLKIIESYLEAASTPETSFNKKIRHNPVILIVDDEPRNVKLLMAKLSNTPFQLEYAMSGPEAIERAQTILPDLILLDIMMPQMDGYEVARQLKSDPELCQTPIIMVTSLDSSEDKIKGIAAGAEEFLTKPVNAMELKARINSMIRLKQYQEQITSRIDSLAHFSITDDQFIEEIMAPPRILVVEDTENDLKLLTKHLTDLQAEVLVARNGEDALKMVAKEPVDLILLDLILPGISGYEVCDHIKSKDETEDIQIVLVTGISDLESRIRGVELGCDDFLIKPVDGRELIARVKVLLKKRQYLKKLRSDYRSVMASAIHDGLTGLYNRAYFMHFLELEIKRSQRRNHGMGLLMIDLDRFKYINDNLGHLAGDQLLVEVASVIRGGVREVDLVARFGGEEFTVIMPYIGAKGIAKAALRLNDLIRQFPYSIKSDSAVGSITASIGVALFPTHARTPNELISKADKMLYRAKETGRNKVCIYQS